MLKSDLQQLRLADGRTVACASPAEARMLWDEMSADGYYRQAAARLRTGDIALDVGANIGLSAMMFADACPGIQVIAVEPAPVTFQCLEQNVAAHIPGGVALQIALGAEPGTAPFTWYPRASSNSSLYADRAADDAATAIFLRNSGLQDPEIALITDGLHEGEQIDVEVTTVSAVLEKHGNDAGVGLLKIDVERAEMDVMRGISVQDWPRIRSVVAEVHDRDGRLDEVHDLLSSYGYSTQTRQDPSLVGSELYEVFAIRD